MRSGIAVRNIVERNVVVQQLMHRHEYDAEQVLEWCESLISEHCGNYELVLEQLDLEVTIETRDAVKRIAVMLFGIHPWPRMGEK